ncbi:MAG TPA: hypothetical protein VL652_26155 [Kutzneria sp.]|nr:hypothetical protein [Kutzneria sp.]
MSTQDTGDHGSPLAGRHSAEKPSVRWPLVRDCIGIALAEALFFWLIAHFRHPSSMWHYATPFALIPVLCAVPGLALGGRRRVLVAAKCAVIGGVVLVLGCGVLALFDRMSD